MKRDVIDNPTAPIKQVYNAAVARMQRHPVQGGGDRPPRVEAYHSFRTVLNRTRVSQLPEIPVEVEDVVIEGQWAETWLQERFLLHQDNDLGIALFAPDANLTALQQCREIYMDGTFRCCPRPYVQFFTIIGRYRGWIVPLVTVLMANRNIGCYRQVLTAVKRQVRLITHRRWQPQIVICDFEQALINAVETELPNADVRGCYFHFTQNLWRRVQELGLAVPYRRNRRLRKCIRKVMSLGYLPMPIMQMNFNLLRTARRTTNLINRYPALMDFFAYIMNTYVNGTFPPALWNVYERNMGLRTNNNLESYHRVLNDTVVVKHPSLWTFIRHLRDIQANVESSINSADLGDAPPPRRRKWRQLEARLQRLKDQYVNGERDLDSYWQAVSHCVGYH
ncbi:uncharacterized protein LOC135500972 [Lineus longissimus]|uniref:uncharacterized protein LOC135500972 n=1 Tax=Lineus longissimus TaxID=88925 RepID=UPI00315CC52E